MYLNPEDKGLLKFKQCNFFCILLIKKEFQSFKSYREYVRHLVVKKLCIYFKKQAKKTEF